MANLGSSHRDHPAAWGLDPAYGHMVPRLGHVILYVSDLVASVEFYRDVAGLEHRFTEAGYAEFGTGATRFALYERRRAEWLTGHPVLPGPAGEIVLIVEDVDAVAAALHNRGIALLTDPADRPWGHRTVHIADPDGFVVEFAQEIPRVRSRRAG
jgi:lactoylglutathione lyase